MCKSVKKIVSALIATAMIFTSYKVDNSSLGTLVVVEAATVLASAYIIFKDFDLDVVNACLQHPEQLFTFADNTKSNSVYINMYTFEEMDTAKDEVDYYLEVGFESATDRLKADESMEVLARFTKSDWSNYDQSNDYSLYLWKRKNSILHIK